MFTRYFETASRRASQIITSFSAGQASSSPLCAGVTHDATVSAHFTYPSLVIFLCTCTCTKGMREFLHSIVISCLAGVEMTIILDLAKDGHRHYGWERGCKVRVGRP